MEEEEGRVGRGKGPKRRWENGDSKVVGNRRCVVPVGVMPLSGAVPTTYPDPEP